MDEKIKNLMYACDAMVGEAYREGYTRGVEEGKRLKREEYAVDASVRQRQLDVREQFKATLPEGE